MPMFDYVPRGDAAWRLRSPFRTANPDRTLLFIVVHPFIQAVARLPSTFMDTQKPLPGVMEADLVSLEIPFPPRLAEAFGYQGLARFVGFHWDPVGDELRYDDGRRSGPGDTWAFLAYRQHPTV